MKKIIKCFLALITMLTLSACEENLNYKIEEVDGKMIYTIEDKKYEETTQKTNFVKIEIEDKGIMVAQLYEDIAPITVENFKKLISEKFYDGLTFHRVIEDFMIQTGDPTATGTGGSEENIKGEFALNGVTNNLSHVRGVLSMARRGANPDTEETMNSASSQFFIVHKDSDFLDGNYAAFGKLIAGYEVLDKIATTQTDYTDKPLSKQTMKSVTFLKQIGE